jgi:hypothetical protein
VRRSRLPRPTQPQLRKSCHNETVIRRSGPALAVALLLILAPACHRNHPAAAIDPALARCIPPGTYALAGVRFDAVRASPLFARLRTVLPPAPLLDQSSSALLAWDGRDLLVAARGAFTQPPAGATLAAPGIAVAGPEPLVRAALAQYRSGSAATPALFDHADPLAAAWPIWAILPGGFHLPLSGNAANFTRLLRGTEFTTLGIRPSAGLEIRAAGVCRSPQDAARLEQTLRAILTLTRAGMRKTPATEQLFETLALATQNRTVTLSLAAPEPLANTMLDSLVPAR